jgi:hypothetical protein
VALRSVLAKLMDPARFGLLAIGGMVFAPDFKNKLSCSSSAEFRRLPTSGRA